MTRECPVCRLGVTCPRCAEWAITAHRANGCVGCSQCEPVRSRKGRR